MFTHVLVACAGDMNRPDTDRFLHRYDVFNQKLLVATGKTITVDGVEQAWLAFRLMVGDWNRVRKLAASSAEGPGGPGPATADAGGETAADGGQDEESKGDDDGAEAAAEEGGHK